jgi:hypothetical protein
MEPEKTAMCNKAGFAADSAASSVCEALVQSITEEIPAKFSFKFWCFHVIFLTAKKECTKSEEFSKFV